MIGGPSRPQVRKRWSSKRARIGPVRTATSSGHAAAAPEQGVEPARAHLDVVVDEAHELGVGGLQRGVARGVQAARRGVGEVARAVALGGRARRLVGPVVDDEHLGTRRAGLRDDRRQRDLEIGGPALGRDGDGGLHGMGTLALPRP